jgi:hypothetical protein
MSRNNHFGDGLQHESRRHIWGPQALYLQNLSREATKLLLGRSLGLSGFEQEDRRPQPVEAVIALGALEEISYSTGHLRAV